MAQRTNDTLKGFFENNDTVTATTFGDLIDSYLSLVETSAQTVTSPVTISAVSFIQASGTRVQAQETDVSALTVTGAFSADAGSVNFSTVSASSLNVKTTISGSAAYFTSLNVGGSQVGASARRLIEQNYSSKITVATSGSGLGFLAFYNSHTVTNNTTDLSAAPSGSPVKGHIKYKGADGGKFFVFIDADVAPAYVFNTARSFFILKNSASRPGGEQFRTFPHTELRVRLEASGSRTPICLHGFISAEQSAWYGLGVKHLGINGDGAENAMITFLEI